MPACQEMNDILAELQITAESLHGQDVWDLVVDLAVLRIRMRKIELTLHATIVLERQE